MENRKGSIDISYFNNYWYLMGKISNLNVNQNEKGCTEQ